MFLISKHLLKLIPNTFTCPPPPTIVPKYGRCLVIYSFFKKKKKGEVRKEERKDKEDKREREKEEKKE